MQRYDFRVRAGNSGTTGNGAGLVVGTNTVLGHVAGNIVAATLVAGQVATNTLTAATQAQMATNTVKANATAGTANEADLAVGTNTVVGRVAGNIVAAQIVAPQIADGVVTNAKLANMANATFKLRTTAGAGPPEDGTPAQATALLDVATAALKGLGPARSGVATEYLDGTGGYSTPAGGGSPITVQDEGSNITTALATMNFVGAGVTVTGGATSTVTIPGGSGSPGGASGDVQFNDAAAFGGAANVKIASGNLNLLAVADPAAPAAGVVFYARALAGRNFPKVIGPAGIDTILQPSFGGNAIFMVGPSNAASPPTVTGGIVVTAATLSTPFTPGGNRWTSTKRMRFQTTTTAGNALSIRTGYTQWYRGNAAERGGFIFRAQFGMGINLNGGRKFIGLVPGIAALGASDPSTLLNMCGVGYDAADASSGNLIFMRNDGAGTAIRVDLGATHCARAVDVGWELFMAMKPNSDELFVLIINLNTGGVALDTSYTTDVPAANTAMAFNCFVGNAAVAAADSIDCAKVYIETDF